MFEYIKGILKEASPLLAIIEVHGIGYKVAIPLNTYSALPNIETEVLLYISSVIREDAHNLYGFLHKEDRDLFEKFNTISGIGPKTSLALIGHLHANDLQMAILETNTSIICKIPGIGKKTAERLILELKDKLGKTAPPPVQNSLAQDAIQALLHLGYNPLQSQKAVQKIVSSQTDPLSLSELITSALRSI